MNDTNTKLRVAKNIKQLMANKKINRKQLAEDLDVKYSTLCEWLKGNKMPRPEKLDLLAKYFNTSVDHFFIGLDDEFAEDNNGVVYPIYDYIPANVDINEIPEERADCSGGYSPTGLCYGDNRWPECRDHHVR